MTLSILHRITGVALALGTLLVVFWIVAVAAGPAAYDAASALLGSWLGRLLLFGWTFSLFYHLANGIRHLAWDVGWGYELGAARASGYLAVTAAVVLTLLSWAAGYGLLGG